jgi:hypothetical protein
MVAAKKHIPIVKKRMSPCVPIPNPPGFHRPSIIDYMEISTTWKNESLLGELFGKNQYVIEIEGRHLKTSKAKTRPEDNLCRDFRARFLVLNNTAPIKFTK